VYYLVINIVKVSLKGFFAMPFQQHLAPRPLDRIDRNILRELQEDGRLSNVELAKRVGLSPTPCLERVRKLEAEGFITGYTALVDPVKVGAALLVFVEITLSKTSPEGFDEFSKAVQKLDEILECHLVSGSFDFLLKTRVANMAAYRELLGETLLRLPSVRESRTYVVMEEVKQTTMVSVLA
jgi:Lrp/AsnC family leucine-responsive transcriptional regulator